MVKLEYAKVRDGKIVKVLFSDPDNDMFLDKLVSGGYIPVIKLPVPNYDETVSCIEKSTVIKPERVEIQSKVIALSAEKITALAAALREAKIDWRVDKIETDRLLKIRVLAIAQLEAEDEI